MDQHPLFGDEVERIREKKVTPVQRVVGEYVEASASFLGFRPPRAIVKAAGARIADLLAQGIPEDVVARAAVLAALRGLPVSAFDRMVVEAVRENRVLKVRNYVAINGWPTGTRFVRSGGSGSYVADPLGHDRAPYSVPWAKPTYDEIIAALGDD